MLLAASDFADDAPSDAANPREAAIRAETREQRLLRMAKRKFASGALRGRFSGMSPSLCSCTG